MAKTWTVIYRTGGKENFRWHRSLAVGTYAEAEAIAEKIERGGRQTHIHNTATLDAVGLPETFSPYTLSASEV